MAEHTAQIEVRMSSEEEVVPASRVPEESPAIPEESSERVQEDVCWPPREKKLSVKATIVVA